MLELKRMPNGKPVFSLGRYVHTHTIGKSPNQRTEKLSFVSEGFFLLRAQYDKEKKDYRREKDSGNSFLWGGQLDPLLQNNKGQVFGPKIILPYLQQGNSSGNNFQRFLYSLIVSLQQSKEFKDKLKGICSSASCCTTSTVPGMAPLPNSRLS